MKMKAVVLYAGGAAAPYVDSRPLRVEEVDLAPPKAGEVQCRIGGAGLCHSDLSIINGSTPRALPMVLGHVGSGIVVVVGPGVADVKPDDHVVFQFRTSCGRCRRSTHSATARSISAIAAASSCRRPPRSTRRWKRCDSPTPSAQWKSRDLMGMRTSRGWTLVRARLMRASPALGCLTSSPRP